MKAWGESQWFPDMLDVAHAHCEGVGGGRKEKESAEERGWVKQLTDGGRQIDAEAKGYRLRAFTRLVSDWPPRHVRHR